MFFDFKIIKMIEDVEDVKDFDGGGGSRRFGVAPFSLSLLWPSPVHSPVATVVPARGVASAVTTIFHIIESFDRHVCLIGVVITEDAWLSDLLVRVESLSTSTLLYKNKLCNLDLPVSSYSCLLSLLNSNIYYYFFYKNKDKKINNLLI
ncbi:uncharacterized protein BP01DRAFT_370067 [Aspergillus saccharolyticus JOP 1030-1]|uniref:Uncharacterized protein n=1 Tax=Aspergillus saccharolyticus JOP 1030-1 TaxID=1450539 RepID=A0A318YYZ8_9EURO|nr:hypothetical protein BP01DRAFT_370067 [Aspergillus saccharolyticus JOP 1030-1]PYH40231.1 hypothetical protein BP01DRAFT_370067 [Aspergillus saccharolyticus JOP 1030-1]